MAIKFIIGFISGIIFIILSGVFIGGIVFSELIPFSGSTFYFIILGLPYAFVAGLVFGIILKMSINNENILKKVLFFGLGFWFSFLSLYFFGYLAFSNFGF